MPKEKKIFEFSCFRVDVAERRLTRDGHPVPLRGKVFDTLCVLLENHGHLLTKDQLLSAVWPDSVVEETNLNHNISVLRKALGEKATGQRYLETVPRQGYRFVAEVRETCERNEASAPDSRNFPSAVPAPSEPNPDANESVAIDISSELYRSDKQVSPLPPPSASHPQHLRQVGIIVLLTVVALITIRLTATKKLGLPSSPPHRSMLAVLPFENLTGDVEQDYISDGMSEEMITQLGSWNPAQLGVIARTSSMSYKNTKKSVAQIGRELGVDFIVEGSVRRAGERLRVTAQLIGVQNQTRLWANNYERTLDDVLALQDEVARTVAQEIGVRLAGQRTGSSSAAVRVSPEAYRHYLKGRYLWKKQTSWGLEQARYHFQCAIALEPGYASAYAGLADILSLLPYYSGVSPQVAFPKAKAAALKALQLDGTLAEAQTSLATIAYRYDWDWSSAEKAYLRALELDPNYAPAHQGYALFLMSMGKLDKAKQEIERAEELDPLSPAIDVDVSRLFYFERQYNLALERLLKVVETDPNFIPAHVELREQYERQGRFDKAIEECRKIILLTGGHQDTASAVERAYAESGAQGYWRKRLELAQTGRERIHIPPSHIVRILTSMGKRDQAIRWLERAFAQHDDELVWLKVDPSYDVLRQHPNFQGLQKRMAFPG